MRNRKKVASFSLMHSRQVRRLLINENLITQATNMANDHARRATSDQIQRGGLPELWRKEFESRKAHA